MKPVKRIAMLLNDDFSMWHFFQGLLRTLVREKYEVYVLTPAGNYTARLESLGVIHLPTPLKRFVDPAGDLLYCAGLAWIFRTRRIDLVCNITIKPIVYGAIAARLARVPHVVGMVEGLGYTFAVARGLLPNVLLQVTKFLYRTGCFLSDRVGFANPDDLRLFLHEGYLPRYKGVGFRSMIGVNTCANFPGVVSEAAVEAVRTELLLPPGRPVVLMMLSRVVWSKGTREFVEVSRLASTWPIPPVFLLVGPRDPEARDAIPEEYLRAAESPNFIWVDRLRPEVQEFLTLSSVVTQPSYYREGVPRILLEALAFAKPIVTTDHVGCRETVAHGVNGFLVPVQDTAAFAAAVRRLVEDPPLAVRFGRESRLKAEREFSETKVVESVVTRLFRLEPSSIASAVGTHDPD